MFNIQQWSKQANIIADVLSKAPKVDKNLRVGGYAAGDAADAGFPVGLAIAGALWCIQESAC